jgi:ferredoxin, 2Fe-2S
MVKIVIENLCKKEVVVNDFSVPVLQQLHAHHIDWMHGCGGKGRCTTCKMIVIAGMENISPLSVAEERYREMGALSPSERLTCQAKITGSIQIQVPEEYKFPHIQYT